MAGSIDQRDKHLSTAAPMLSDTIRERRIAALKLVLAMQPFKNTLGRMKLFARTFEIPSAIDQ